MDMGVSTNDKSKNAIDQVLIDELKVVEDAELLSKFDFSSDHIRFEKCLLQISKKKSYKIKKHPVA